MVDTVSIGRLLFGADSLLLQWLFVLLLTANVKGNDCPVSVDTPGSTSCLRPNDFTRSVPFQDIGGRGSSVFPSGAQVIIPSYTFQCCGTITLWRTYVQPGGREDGQYDITFQVWRPSDTVLSSGCYSLVGENTFDRIDLGSGGLVCEAPAAGSEIRVQPGDVVGLLNIHADGGDRGVQLDNSFDSETVWYEVDAQPSGDPQCVYSVGGNSGRLLQRFTNYAPILSVTLYIEECPSVSNATSATATLPSPSSPTTSPPPSPDSVMPPTDNAGNRDHNSHPNPKPQEQITTISEPVTTLTPTTPTPTNLTGPGLTTDKIIGLVFGALAVLVLLATIKTVLVIFVVNHRRQRRDKTKKGIHAFIDATLSYNNLYARGEIVLLSQYSNAERVVNSDYTYADPQYMTVSPSLNNSQPSTKLPTNDSSSTCYYVQPNKSVRYDQPRNNSYDQPRNNSYDQPRNNSYDQPRSIQYDRPSSSEALNESSTKHLVVPYAIANASLCSTLSRGDHSSQHSNNDYITRSTNFNVATNEAYAMSDGVTISIDNTT